MRVKKLDIYGFKSFALKQSLSFGEGVTAIVGPNGCGKSNVVDALRWVMGEQNARHLRGGNMQDIIFCGSEKKAALGFAEVVLTIENHQQNAPLEYNHFNEIEICRRLYKTGESEYEINKQKARLRDIADFFLGTGVGTKAYSIIEQGRVNEIISAKPTERRLIIEEAAGITKYKSKKFAAERRMEATRTNLDRIIDIKNEVDKRVASLLREKEKLEKLTVIKMRIKDIDLHIATHQYLEAKARETFLHKAHAEIEQKVLDNKRNTAVIEHEFEKILADYSQRYNQKRLLEELEQHHKNSLELLKKDQSHAHNNLSDTIAQTRRIAVQLEEIEQRKQELLDDIEKFKIEHDRCQQEYMKAHESWANKQASGQGVIDKRQGNLQLERDTQRQLLEAATKAARLQAEITLFDEAEAQKKIDHKNLRIDIEQKHTEHRLAADRLITLQKELNDGLEQRQNLDEEKDHCETSLIQITEKCSHALRQMQNVHETKMKLELRAKSLAEIAERCEWSDSGVSEIISSHHKNLIKGLVANSIKVEKGFEDIVEKCLTHLLESAILKDSDDLNVVANFLRQKKAAPTSFIVLQQNKKPLSNAKLDGLTKLTDVMSVDDIDLSSLQNHFVNFYIATTLTQAIEHWPQAQAIHATIISLEGDLLLPDGRVIVKSDEQRGQGVLKRKNEMDDLAIKLADLDKQLTDAKKNHEHADSERAACIIRRDKFAMEQKTLSLRLVRLEEVVKQVTQEITRIASEEEKLNEKLEQLSLSETISDEKRLSLSEQWASALEEHRMCDESLVALNNEKSLVEREYEEFLAIIKETEIAKATLHEQARGFATNLSEAQKNLQHLASQTHTLATQSEEKSQEHLILEETIRQNENKLETLVQEIAATQKMLASEVKLCGELHVVKIAKEQELDALKSSNLSLIESLHTKEINLAAAVNHITNIADRIKEKYRVNLLHCLTDFHHQPLHFDTANKEKTELQKSQERLGFVNENAGVEYEEFYTRSLFLKTQVDDLQDALTQLETAIKKINKTTQMRFNEAFHSINQQFSKVFPRLFNGGKAELVLTDEADLLNSGVDIMAKPPGKNIGSIELMSGGEKALTAISLIMAIFLIKPSPFCLLDEVDAPLDEANVARFSQLIKEMSSISQFIVITHNRKTMEAADQLYGVTMEDAGQSKIVSVRVQEAYLALKQDQPQPLSKKPKQLWLDEMLE